MTALGLIETKGLLAAVESADVMLKTADVRLLEKHLVGGGLVTVTVAGEVAAVKVSVEAAVTALRRLEARALVSAHVIARPDAELAEIMMPGTTPAPSAPSFAKAGAGGKIVPRAEAAAPRGGKRAVKTVPAGTAKNAAPRDMVLLKKMGIGRLRQLALALQGLGLTKDDIAAAERADLLEAIMRVYGK